MAATLARRCRSSRGRSPFHQVRRPRGLEQRLQLLRAWLSWRVGLDTGAAREHVRVARALGTLPLLAQAFARGEMSYSKVRELTRVATPETEERLLTVGRAGTANHVERIVRGWRRVDQKAEAREGPAAREPGPAGVSRRGRHGDHPRPAEPEVGALLMQALAAAREALYRRAAAASRSPWSRGDPPTMGQQQADALALLAETALHHGMDPGAPGERYQVVVHVDAAVLAEPEQPGQSVLEDGVRVPAGTSQRLACDASRVVMRHDADGRVVEVGARTRTIPPALRRALHHRDRGCRFPGCGVRVGQGHHIRHWAQGGPTTLSNLALLCRRHHRAVHEEGYQVDRQADGELRFRRPNGRVLPEVPTPPEVRGDAVEVLRARHDAEGLVLHARTASRAGSASGWTWAGRSTSCIPWRGSSASSRSAACCATAPHLTRRRRMAKVVASFPPGGALLRNAPRRPVWQPRSTVTTRSSCSTRRTSRPSGTTSRPTSGRRRRPSLHPGTGQPIGPADLAPLFPMELIKQEVSRERWIEIPEEVRDVYRLWRPTPAVPRAPAGEGARHARPASTTSTRA